MDKVGIYTLFYKSINYGGILQAYALNRRIREMGYSSETINFNNDITLSAFQRVKIQLNKHGVLKFILKCFEVFIRNYKQKILAKLTVTRRTAFKKFIDNNITYSEIYNSKTIHQVADIYDIFVCGSDQVWNLGDNVSTASFFDYVPVNKLKVAYAPSFGINTISLQSANIIRPYINNFNYLSVREIQGKKILSELTSKDVTLVADPVFLLDKAKWDEICSNPIINEPYIFCYFLGNIKKYRKIVNDFKLKTGIKVVNIPNLTVNQVSKKKFVGDINLPDASPSDFISLIKNASYILTDSFHATAFSIIYEKEFFAFKRFIDNDSNSMNSRLTSILSLSGLEDRLYDVNNVNDINIYKHINFEKVQSKMSSFIKESDEFLKTALKNKK